MEQNVKYKFYRYLILNCELLTDLNCPIHLTAIAKVEQKRYFFGLKFQVCVRFVGEQSEIELKVVDNSFLTMNCHRIAI